MKKGKIGANTPQAFKPPNSTRAQKPHNQRKAPNPYKYTSAPQTALKTPLKREIGHICKRCDKHKAGKRAKAGRKGRNTPKEREQEHTTFTQWTPPPPQRESHNGSPCTLKI